MNQSLGETDTKVEAGNRNTDIIIDYLRNAGESGRAAQLAREYTQGGYRDWFLPSKDEMKLIYNRDGLIGDFSLDWYWSSSEASSGTAWVQRFSDGSREYLRKSDLCSVRAVRAFLDWGGAVQPLVNQAGYS